MRLDCIQAVHVCVLGLVLGTCTHFNKTVPYQIHKQTMISVHCVIRINAPISSLSSKRLSLSSKRLSLSRKRLSLSSKRLSLSSKR